MAKDHQLLNTTRDYFQFVTNFFDVIKVSATHIYHSALELSPLSSVVRRFYYSQQPHPLPIVLTGVPDLWDDVMASVSIELPIYQPFTGSPFTWSPCGHFVAGVINGTVEIRGALTLNLLSTLQSAGVAIGSRLTYSPDGHSLACCSYTAIIIWDTQTGGVVRKIDCGATNMVLELVWSLDGNMISIISQAMIGAFTVHIYEIVSSTMQSFSEVDSRHNVCLWAHDKSFRAMTTTRDDKGSMINIYEVGSTLTKVEQFHFQSYLFNEVFSPTTYRIAFHDPDKLLILNVHNSEVLLQESGLHHYATFSPDGNFVAAVIGGRLLIWRYTSGHYTRWREFQQKPDFFQFSPTSPSILSCKGPLLSVAHLDHSPAAPTIESGATIHRVPLDAYHSHGTYIAMTHHGESAITITNLCSQNPSPSQFIDTSLEILAIVLTGNVLLVRDLNTVVAWLLTEEGVLGGTFGERRMDRSDSLWDVQFQADNWGLFDDLKFWVEGEIAVVMWYSDLICGYHTKTGEILNLSGAHLNSEGYRFDCSEDSRGPNHYHSDSYKLHEPPECRWPVPGAIFQEGWVKDPEGKHRLWLPPRWRLPWIHTEWFDRVTTLRLKPGPSETVIIKF